MAKHKAPTQVSIASTEEETGLSVLVKSYGKPVLGAAIIVSCVILYREWATREQQAGVNAGWEELGRDVELNGAGFMSQGITSVSTIAMEAFSETQGDTPASAWAKALELGQHLRDDNQEAAARALGELQNNWPDHILNNQALFPESEEAEAGSKLLSDHISTRSSALKQWMMDNKTIFEAMPMPKDAPKVRFNTSAGSFVIGLRSALAPEHCANFLRLCEEGFYDNILFHGLEKDKYIESGSVASRDPEAKESWGTDDNGTSIKPEVGQLWNFQFAVGAARSIDFPSESSDCRFYIVSGIDAHDRDRDYTVFGSVIEGTDTISTINAGTVLGSVPDEPVVIQSTEVL